MKEANVQRLIWKGVPFSTVLFRVNTGKAVVSGGGKVRWLEGGAALVPFARPITLGFGTIEGDPVKGTADLVGYTERTITADMVGQKIAQFTVIETKESGGGIKGSDQIKFINRVKQAGGLAGFAKSVEEALAILRGE